MELDFSGLQPLMNEMVFSLAIFIFGTLIVVSLVADVMDKLKFPLFIMQPAITLLVIGCLFYWTKYIL